MKKLHLFLVLNLAVSSVTELYADGFSDVLSTTRDIVLIVGIVILGVTYYNKKKLATDFGTDVMSSAVKALPAEVNEKVDEVIKIGNALKDILQEDSDPRVDEALNLAKQGIEIYKEPSSGLLDRLIVATNRLLDFLTRKDDGKVERAISVAERFEEHLTTITKADIQNYEQKIDRATSAVEGVQHAIGNFAQNMAKSVLVSTLGIGSAIFVYKNICSYLEAKDSDDPTTEEWHQKELYPYREYPSAQASYFLVNELTDTGLLVKKNKNKEYVIGGSVLLFLTSCFLASHWMN